MSATAHVLAEATRLLNAGRHAEALTLAQRALDGARTCLPGHSLLASLLLALERNAEANAVIAAAMALEPGNGDAYDGLAFVSMRLGAHERANLLYHRATEVAPRDPRFWYNLACSERSLGRLGEAAAACERAIGLDATQYASWLLRSELSVQTEQHNHVAELTARLTASAQDYRARVLLGYALGKELDDLGRYEEAFTHFCDAATTRRRQLQYDIALDEGKLKRIAAVYTREASRPAAELAPTDSERFVFVIGLPRSGTTLVERILSGLPGVRSNGETDAFSRALLAAARGSGDVFARCAAADAQAVADGYAALANPGAPARRIIEKLPLNYLYAGAIRKALPGAALVLLRRSPLDSCFAMYRTLFGVGYPFSYDLIDLARYYVAWQQLVSHWHAVLGEALYEVNYEELVGAPAKVAPGVAVHCGLEWQDEALEIQKNGAVSLTASASQVRRPIYGSSSGRWRHYRRQLEPLIQALERCGVNVDH